MADSLRDIRENIKNVKNIQQIMNTMKMISSARIKKAQGQILSSRPFATKMRDMLHELEIDAKENDSPIKDSWAYSFFENLPNTDKNVIGIILVTADKGLCGGFNAVLIKEALDIISKNKDKKIYLFLMGKKGRDFLGKLDNKNIEIVYEAVDIFPKINYANATLLGDNLVKTYLEKKLSKVYLVFNEFKSMASQRLISQELLPFNFSDLEAEHPNIKSNFLFEPNERAFFELLLPRHIKVQLYRFLLESQAAELAARLLAMDAAGKNAGDIVEELSLKLNRTRQELITSELSEIIGGAEALKS